MTFVFISVTEMEGARETVMWGATQVIGAIGIIAGLIHGETVSLAGADDEEEGDEVLDGEGAGDEEKRRMKKEKHSGSGC